MNSVASLAFSLPLFKLDVGSVDVVCASARCCRYHHHTLFHQGGTVVPKRLHAERDAVFATITHLPDAIRGSAVGY